MHDTADGGNSFSTIRNPDAVARLAMRILAQQCQFSFQRVKELNNDLYTVALRLACIELCSIGAAEDSETLIQRFRDQASKLIGAEDDIVDDTDDDDGMEVEDIDDVVLGGEAAHPTQLTA